MMESRPLAMSVCFAVLESIYGLCLYFGESRVACGVLISAFFRLFRPVIALFIISLVCLHESGYVKAMLLSKLMSSGEGDTSV